MAFNYKTEYQKYRRRYLQLERGYLAKREVRVYVGLAFGFMAMAFFIFFAIKPTLLTIGSLLSEIRSQAEIDSRLSAKVESLRLAHANYSKLQDRFFLLDQVGGKWPEISAFARQAETLASENGVAITTFILEELDLQQASTEYFSPAKFTLVASGGYEALNAFARDLENLRRIVKVESYSMLREELNLTELKLVVNGGIFYFPGRAGL